MFESLEKRFYPREELAAIAGLDAEGHNFSAQMKRTLTLWGYEYEFKPRRGFTITKVPTTPEEKLIEILRRDVRIDTQVNIFKFSCFVSAFILIPNFMAMPWRTRETMLREYFAVKITDRTMLRWKNKLTLSQYLLEIRSPSLRTLWRTLERDGKRVQEIADPEGEEYKTYSKLRSGILKGYEAMGISSRVVWGDMVHQLYKEHGVYYYCYDIEFNAFKWRELDTIRELTLEIIRTKTD